MGRLFPLLRQAVGTGDDWNHWWMQKFNNYREIPKALDQVIELGCGPFTNVRLIRKRRTIRRIVCSDPLARDYVSFGGFWLAEAYRRGLVEVDFSPAEDLPFESASFDLVVMINVLDHVRDSDACLRSAERICRPGAYLILGQDLTSEDDIVRIGDDVGHPIRVDHVQLERALAGFVPVFTKILPREEGRNPEAHYGTFLMIGRKKSGNE